MKTWRSNRFLKLCFPGQTLVASTSPLMNLGAAFWVICPLVAADVPLPFPGFFIFSLQPQTVNCHAPQTVTMRMRNKRRNAPCHVVNGPTPDAYRTPNGAYPGAGALVNYGRKLSPRILLPQTGNRKKSSLRKGELDISHGSDDIVSIWGLITIEAADMYQILS